MLNISQNLFDNFYLLKAWKYAKILEVTVSDNALDPYSPGFVALIQDG